MASERVVLVNGDRSSWFEQAIFVIRKDLPQANVPLDFVAEAERIIDGYLTGAKNPFEDGPKVMVAATAKPAVTTTAPQPASKAAAKPMSGRALNLVMMIGLIVLAGLLWYAFKR